MIVDFKSKKLWKACSDEKEMQKRWDDITRDKLDQRLSELSAATCLADISHLPPPRLHAYTNDPNGKLSIDVHGGVRILFRVGDDPVPLRKDGSLNREAVTHIVIVSVDDPHDKKHKKSR